MDKNVTKNIVIIVLVIFLGFSAVLNAFYIYRNQALNQQDNGLVFFDSFPRNQTIHGFQFKNFTDLPQSFSNCSAVTTWYTAPYVMFGK